MSHPRVLLSSLSTAVAMLVGIPSSRANPQLDIQFACPATLDAADRARIDRPQAVALTFPAPFNCAIFYGNNGTTAVDAEFTVTFPSVDLQLWRDPARLDTDGDHDNRSELPDGVLRPFGLGRGFAWTAPFVQHMRPVTGFPNFDGNAFDRANQRIRYTRAVDAGQTTSLQFHATENFHFTDYNSHFPSGAYEIVLTARVNGAMVMNGEAPARWVVPVNVAAGGLPQLATWPTNVAVASSSRVRADGLYTGYFAAGLATHVNAAAARFPVQTSAYVRIHLPYWNGTAFVADGAYDPLNPLHLPALDASRLTTSLVRRPNAGYGTAGQVLEEVVTDGGDDGPFEGANAGKLVRFDPTTQTLYGTFGALGLNNNAYRNVPPVPLPGAEVLDRVALRYSAPFNAAVLPLLTAGTAVPAMGCYESDQTGPAVAGSTTLCRSGRHLVGDEPWRDHNFWLNPLNSAQLVTESAPLGPGSVTQMWADCANLSGRSRDVDFYLQIPADTQGTPALDLTRLEIQGFHGYGPATAQRYEIHVSTRAADHSNPQNTSLRQVPMAGAGDWVLCKAIDASAIAFGDSAGATLACTRNDIVALGLDPLALQEVRFRLVGQRPVALAALDANQGCGLGMVGTARDVMPNSIDETCSGGTERYDRFALTQVQGTTGTASFGTVGRTVSAYADGRSRTETVGANAEFARRAAVGVCHGSGGSACYYTVSDTQIGRTERLYVSVGNSGSAPMRAPFQFCGTLPTGFNVLTINDPAWNGKRFIYADGARVPASIRRVLLPRERYQVDFDAETRRVCVTVPEAADAQDPWNALYDELVIEFWGEVVPGASRTMRMTDTTWNWREDTVCAVGVARTASAVSAGGFNLGLTADVRLASTTTPAVVGPGGGFCYETALQNRAYDFLGRTVQNNAGSARDSVAYFRMPQSTGGVAVAFEQVSSPDARIWVSTAALAPGDLRSGTSLIASHTDAATGFVPCAPSGAGCTVETLAALGISAAQVTWLAAEIGELLVTDAAPLGVGPAPGTPPVNRPYGVAICLRDANSVDGSAIISEVFFRSTDTADATDTTGAMRVVVDHDCPDGSGAEPEVCDGLDNDCDGAIDEDFSALPGWEELGDACSEGDGACRDDGVWICPDPQARLGFNRNELGLCAATVGGYGISGQSLIHAEGLWRLRWSIVGAAGNPALQSVRMAIPPGCVADAGWLSAAGQRVPATVERRSDGVTWTFASFALPGTSAELVVDSRCAPDELFAAAIQLTTSGGAASGACAFAWTAPEPPPFMCTAEPGAPGLEICDGVDNDCNGAVDDAAGTGEACVVGLGECAAPGVTVCPPDGGSRFDCAGTPGAPAAAERCDERDWNCNGQPLDGFPEVGAACTATPAGCTVALAGTWVCKSDGSGVTCELGAIATTDTDRDGTPDACDCAPSDARFAALTAGQPTACDGDGDGHCRPGLDTTLQLDPMACPPNAEPDCNDADPTVSPSAPERCNSIDHDCDGEPLNGFDVGDACTVTSGSCVLEGVRVCAAGGGATRCDTGDARCPAPACDVPDGQPCVVGVGGCAREGVTLCDAMTGGVRCSAEPGAPAPEDDCSGRDIDCDGIVDSAPNDCSCDGFAGDVDVCPGAWTPDQRDTNGDGVGDDCDCISNHRVACMAWYGDCVVSGQLRCGDGVRAGRCEPDPAALDAQGQVRPEWCGAAACGPVEPDACRALEGAACVVGVGVCARPGFTICATDGVGVVCDAEAGPAEGGEVCDGRDNDCDGLVDNLVQGSCDAPEPSPEPGPEPVAEPLAEEDPAFVVEGAGGCGGGETSGLWLLLLLKMAWRRRPA